MKKMCMIFIWLSFFYNVVVSAPQEGTVQKISFEKQAELFAMKCSKCHTIGSGDRVGPDLKGVVQRREKDWLVRFISRPSDYFDKDPIAKELLEKYNGVRMEDLNLSSDEVEAAIAYIDSMSVIPSSALTAEESPIPNTVPLSHFAVQDAKGPTLFEIVILFIFLALIGPSWRYKRKWLCGFLIGIACLWSYWCFSGKNIYKMPGNQQSYSPVQPIQFSHALHAGTLKISCFYCHYGAKKSPIAGIPAVNICMNCHQVVKKRHDAIQPSEELKKLYAVWESRNLAQEKSIEWIRVHRLPDFVYFDHSTHVHNGISCKECHGEVEKMEQMKQVSNLTMGWCLNCHRHEGRQAPTHWKKATGALDCSACHI